MGKHLSLLLSVCILLLAGCYGPVDKIAVKSCRIVSFSLSGLKSFDAEAELDIYNPASKFKLSDIEADVKAGGRSVLVLNSEGLSVDAVSDTTWSLPFKGSLPDSFSLLHFVELMKDMSVLRDATVDVKAVVSFNGNRGRIVEYKDVLLKDYLLANEY